MVECPYCAEPLASESSVCPHCDRALPQDAVEVVEEAESDEAPLMREWGSTAQYTLETAARCPYCREPLRTVRVLRMTRTQATFTSTLPRGGRAVVCPQCERILSVEIGALL
jgi:hypothetical protein